MVKLFLFLLLPLTAYAQDIDWGGKLWGNQLQGTKDTIEQNAGTLLNAKGRVTENTLIKSEFIGYYVKSPLLKAPERNLKSGEVYPEINELNASYTQESWNAKVGQNITSWGVSDGLNPTDFLSGKRNTLIVTDDALTRRGHTSAMIEWIPGSGDSAWTIQQWFVPRHSTTDILISRKLTQDLITFQDNKQSGRAEIATKINYAGQGWQFDYTYFNGVNKAPVYSLKSVTATNYRLQPNYVHQQSHGINLSKDFENYVVRFEGAYTHRDEVLKDSDYIQDPSRIDLVAGIEKSFFETHRFNVQGVLNHYPDYNKNTPGQLSEAVQLLNRITLAQHLQTRIGTLLVYHFEPTSFNQVKLKCSWLNYFHKESNGVLSPQIDYQVTDSLQIQTYGMIFNGNKNTPFGVLKQLNSIAMGANYSF